MSPRLAFRLLIMMGCLGGIAYGATRIAELPDGPRRLLSRVGQWLQARADPASDKLASVDRDQSPAGSMPVTATTLKSGTPPVASIQATPSPAAVVVAESTADPPSAAVTPAVVAETRSRLEVLAAQLRELGATRYSVEEWGEEGRLVRCHCVVSLGRLPGLGQHFETVAGTGEEALHRILAEITSSRSR